MQYLILNGSPHKGNTWKLAMLAKEQIAALDTDAQFEEIHLHQKKLPMCLGCSNCFRKGHAFCPHKESMREILAAMEKADGMIVTSSTFYVSPTATLKNLLDHLCYLLHRPQFFKKKLLVLTTTGAVGADRCAKAIASHFTGIGFNRVYQLPLAAHSWNSYTPDTKAVKKLSDITAAFYRDVASGKLHPPKFWDLFSYNLFRGMCKTHIEGHEYPTADGVHWTDPVRARRCYDRAVPVRPGQRVIGGLIYGMGGMMGRRMTISYRK